LSNRWRSFSPARKTAVVLLAVGLIVSIFYLGQLLVRASYAPLFTQLDPKEAGAIVEKLKGMKVQYRLADQGETILVPKSQVYDTRIRLASSGALEGTGKGFELFDQKKLGITDFEQQVYYQRALQEELRRTITQLEGVEQARVHLVLPQKSVFVEDKGAPSASVVLKLKPLAKLKSEQVKGISDLMVGSVEGLMPENVHIIDMDGHVLSEDVKSGESAGLAQKAVDQQQVKRNYEKEMEKRVQEVLERILGPGKAVAMVTADMDFSQQQVTTNVPFGNPAVVSEKTVTERNAGAVQGGMAGTDSNIPPNYPGLANAGAAGGYARDEAVKNYQVGNRQETLIQPPGTMRRLSIAVVVDGNPGAADVQTIQGMIGAAVGSDPARGDQISVSNMAFDNSLRDSLNEEMKVADAALKEAQKRKFYGYLGGAALLLLFFLGFGLFRLLRARGSAGEELVAAAGGDVVPLKVLEKGLQQLEGEELQSGITLRQESVKELAKKSPEDVARILKVWLAED